MNTFCLRRLLLVSLVVLCAVSPASPAFAGPPIFSTVELNDKFTATNLCNFPVEVNFLGTVKISLHELQNGTSVEIQRYFHATATFTANGKSYTSLNAGPNRVVIQPDGTGEWAASGRIALVTFPKEGLLLKDVGRIIWDTTTGEVVFQAGTHPIFVGVPGDVPGLCTLLS